MGLRAKSFSICSTSVHEEMRTSKPELPLGTLVINDTSGIAQPNRPRDNLEVLQHVLLATDDRFGNDALQPGLIVLRDYRGFALVNGSSPGVAGSVPAPFADTDFDGLADVDTFGRFLGVQGEPAAVDAPFFVPGETRIRPADSMGRAGAGQRRDCLPIHRHHSYPRVVAHARRGSFGGSGSDERA